MVQEIFIENRYKSYRDRLLKNKELGKGYSSIKCLDIICSPFLKQSNEYPIVGNTV